MKSNEIWAILADNMLVIVEKMLTLQSAQWLDIYYDPLAKRISFGSPTCDGSVKLASVTAPNLDDSYGFHRQGNGYVDDDGQAFTREELPARLVQLIEDMRDGGNEWGWEFKTYEDV